MNCFLVENSWGIYIMLNVGFKSEKKSEEELENVYLVEVLLSPRLLARNPGKSILQTLDWIYRYFLFYELDKKLH